MYRIKCIKQDAEPCSGGSKLNKNLEKKSLEERVKLLESTVEQLLQVLSGRK